MRQFIPITRPSPPDIKSLLPKLRRILKTGQITNGEFVKRLERKTAKFLCVKESVAVSSATSGLMLLIQALKLKGEVIVPSFTFPATVHALIWNNLIPCFVDCDKETFNISPEKVERAINKRTSAILGVYIFGNPPDMNCLKNIARQHKIKLILDSSHAFGTCYRGRKAGSFGAGEVFSFSPTKTLVTGEGGLITTNNVKLAEILRINRNYGDPGNYNCNSVGLNARMAEFCAIMGLENLKNIKMLLKKREQIAQLYKSLLSNIPGLRFQKNPKGSKSSNKDFAILVDKNRDKLAELLSEKGIQTRKYFYPPAHKQKAYQSYKIKISGKLANTEYVSKRVLCLPIYPDLKESDVRKICRIVKRNSRIFFTS